MYILCSVTFFCNWYRWWGN